MSSSNASSLSNLNPYWKPEQPPPVTKTLNLLLSLVSKTLIILDDADSVSSIDLFMNIVHFYFILLIFILEFVLRLTIEKPPILDFINSTLEPFLN